MIEKTILIEDLVEQLPEAVSYLVNKGIKCIACGDPIWGTLEEAAKEKGFSEFEIGKLLVDINNLANK
jgi:methionine synthase II (cobalamin-independent)